MNSIIMQTNIVRKIKLQKQFLYNIESSFYLQIILDAHAHFSLTSSYSPKRTRMSPLLCRKLTSGSFFNDLVPSQKEAIRDPIAASLILHLFFLSNLNWTRIYLSYFVVQLITCCLRHQSREATNMPTLKLDNALSGFLLFWFTHSSSFYDINKQCNSEFTNFFCMNFFPPKCVFMSDNSQGVT